MRGGYLKRKRKTFSTRRSFYRRRRSRDHQRTFFIKWSDFGQVVGRSKPVGRASSASAPKQRGSRGRACSARSIYARRRLNFDRSLKYASAAASPSTRPLRIQSLARGRGGNGGDAGGRSASTSQLAAAIAGSRVPAAFCRSHACSATTPIFFFSPSSFSPGSLPYGEACSISAFNSAPIKTAKLET